MSEKLIDHPLTTGQTICDKYNMHYGSDIRLRENLSSIDICNNVYDLRIRDGYIFMMTKESGEYYETGKLEKENESDEQLYELQTNLIRVEHNCVYIFDIKKVSQLKFSDKMPKNFYRFLVILARYNIKELIISYDYIEHNIYSHYQFPGIRILHIDRISILLHRLIYVFPDLDTIVTNCYLLMGI
jgi:hypothetical protein